MRLSYFKIITIISFLAVVPATCTGQDFKIRPLQKLIDCPVPGGPPSRHYDFELRISPDGGILSGFSIGLGERLLLGLSYGGTRLISYQPPVWNPHPGIQAAFRLLNEGMLFPGLAIGFTNQGFGRYDRDIGRYQYKAKGVYAVLGKNFDVGSFGEISWIAGVNQNPIEKVQKRLDVFAAFDYRLISSVALLGEFSGALDDRNDLQALGLNRGYLNAGVRWSFAERLSLDFILRDILINQREVDRGGGQIGREVRISYIEKLF